MHRGVCACVVVSWHYYCVPAGDLYYHYLLGPLLCTGDVSCSLLSGAVRMQEVIYTVVLCVSGFDGDGGSRSGGCIGCFAARHDTYMLDFAMTPLNYLLVSCSRVNPWSGARIEHKPGSSLCW